MDGSHFDTLARSFAQTGTRRRLLTLLAALPLGGVLTTRGQDKAAAQQRPIDRLQQRTPQRNRQQRNTNQNNQNTNNKNKNKKNNRNTNDGGGARLGAGDDCLTPADCASGVCCQGTCCQPPATQCNLGGLCCAPNCAGRQCGPDGCGGGGTCGSCSQCQTCSDTGHCQPAANGTPCNDGSPVCLNGQCCTDGHEALHGGCFKIVTGSPCTGCPNPCACFGSIDGSGNFLCSTGGSTQCGRTADCPVGQACFLSEGLCLLPC
jgi:hypothetical protein